MPPPQVDNLSFGFRVPLIVISPWTKRGAGTDGGSISSTFYSQSSILKLVEDNWALPSLDPRDAGSNDMMKRCMEMRDMSMQMMMDRESGKSPAAK